MSSQIVRVVSYTRADVGGIGREVDRKNEHNRNQDIRPEDREKNYIYRSIGKTAVEGCSMVISDAGATAAKRKDLRYMEGMIITSDSEFFKKQGWKKGDPLAGNVKKFFDEAYKWAVKEIGWRGSDRNVVRAVVHMDETTPHLQMYYVPLVAQGTKTTVSGSKFWKNKGGRLSYHRLQNSFYEAVSQKYKQGRGEVGSQAVHRSKEQWEGATVAEVRKVRKALNEEGWRGFFTHAKRDEKIVATVIFEENREKREKDLQKRKADLDARENGINEDVEQKVRNMWNPKCQELNNYAKRLQKQAANLDSREADLKSREADLDSREADLDSREADLDSREADLDSRETNRQILINEGRRAALADLILSKIMDGLSILKDILKDILKGILKDLICTYFHLSPASDEKITPRDKKVIAKAIDNEIIDSIPYTTYAGQTQKGLRDYAHKTGGQVIEVIEPSAAGQSRSRSYGYDR